MKMDEILAYYLRSVIDNKNISVDVSYLMSVIVVLCRSTM
jgi:hypothetical protein